MATSHFTKFLESFDADNNRRGKQWEHVCKWFLETDPVYRDRLKKVWLWKEWPDADITADITADTTTTTTPATTTITQAATFAIVATTIIDPATTITTAPVTTTITVAATTAITNHVV